MRHTNIMKEVSKLNLTVIASVHTWSLNNVKYSEITFEAIQDSIRITWQKRPESDRGYNVMICDLTDPSDPRCDYSGKTSHIYKLKNIIPTFQFFVNTQGNAAFKLAGNLIGMQSGGAQ